MTENAEKPPSGSPPNIVRCWCVPPNTAYLMGENPCTWPDCILGDKPDPNAPEPR